MKNKMNKFTHAGLLNETDEAAKSVLLAGFPDGGNQTPVRSRRLPFPSPFSCSGSVL